MPIVIGGECCDVMGSVLLSRFYSLGGVLLGRLYLSGWGFCREDSIYLGGVDHIWVPRLLRLKRKYFIGSNLNSLLNISHVGSSGPYNC